MLIGHPTMSQTWGFKWGTSSTNWNRRGKNVVPCRSRTTCPIPAKLILCSQNQTATIVISGIQNNQIWNSQKENYTIISIPVERGVYPSKRGETNRASGDASTNIMGGEGWWYLLVVERLSRYGVSSHSHLPSSLLRFLPYWPRSSLPLYWCLVSLMLRLILLLSSLRSSLSYLGLLYQTLRELWLQLAVAGTFNSKGKSETY